MNKIKNLTKKRKKLLELVKKDKFVLEAERDRIFPEKFSEFNEEIELLESIEKDLEKELNKK